MSSSLSKPNFLSENIDILTEILIRLPIDSILKFKLVSKQWCSLISSTQFSRRLYPDPNSILGLLLYRGSLDMGSLEYEFIPLNPVASKVPFSYLPFINCNRDLKIIQSCHGLTCCCGDSETDLFIFNTTTKRMLRLPYPKGGELRSLVGVNLAFDPSKSPYYYKVVCIWAYEQYFQLEIYSSETGYWRLAGDPFSAKPKSDLKFKAGVFWNGALHWITSSVGTSIYFNLDEEQLHEMPMPSVPEGWQSRKVRYFGESRDHLNLVEIYGLFTTEFDVYEMKRDYSRWFVKYHVDLNELVSGFPGIVKEYPYPFGWNYYAIGIACLVQETNENDPYMVIEVPGAALCYNIKDKTFRKICDLSSIDMDFLHVSGSKYGSLYAHQYMESFTSVP